VGNGRKAVVRLLLEQGADPESKDNEGRTPLSRATAGKQEWLKHDPNPRAVMKLLLADPHINLNEKDANGRAPLSWVAEEGYYARMKLMLARDGLDLAWSPNRQNRVVASPADAGSWSGVAAKVIVEKGGRVEGESKVIEVE
jgi:ankyrin repeat protein